MSPFRPFQFGLLAMLLGVPATGLRAVDHTLFDSILKESVTEDGWVDYGRIRRHRAADLAKYLALLAETRVEKLETANERKAFWINAYNAVCVHALIDHGVPASVPKAVFFGTNIFKDLRYKIAGKARTLDDIEHGVLRKEFRDPRIHAALVCGASSCPRLRAEAFDPKRLDAQLDEECKRWVRVGKTKEGKRKNVLDRRKKVFRASKIFGWFIEDFGGDEQGVLNFAKRYMSDADRRFVEKNSVRVEYQAYSWKLNRK